MTRKFQNTIVKCEAQNEVGISSDSESFDVICKYKIVKRICFLLLASKVRKRNERAPLLLLIIIGLKNATKKKNVSTSLKCVLPRNPAKG